jgi:hypothetical protein
VKTPTLDNPRANYQKISKCRGLLVISQRPFTKLRNTEIKASLPVMDNPDSTEPKSAASNSSGLATRIKEGKPGSPHQKVLGHGRQCNNPGSLLQTWSPHPAGGLTHAHGEPDSASHRMPADLHSNGSTHRSGRSHSEREHHDWHTLSRLQVLWRL